MPPKDFEQLKTEMNSALLAVDIKDVSLDQITMRIGGRIVKFQVIGDANATSIETEIRKEYSDKLTKKLGTISEVINNKMNEVTSLVSQMKSEFERKERQLSDRMKNLSPMPEVDYSYARKGLSVFKWERGEVAWLVRGKYRPLMIDHKPIKPSQAKKLENDIYYMITTKDDKFITSVSTRRVSDLELFSHYHQARPDCWGKWVWPKEYKSPQDLIDIARNAEGVLENINSGSVANRNPDGFPRLEVLQRYVVSSRDFKDELNIPDSTIASPRRRRTSWAEEEILNPVPPVIAPAPAPARQVDDVWEVRR